MQYIQLNNDSYILHTSKGITTLNRKSFNFNRIKHLIDKGSDEEAIIPLLKTPPLPEGLYEAYLHLELDIMLVRHKQEGVDDVWVQLNKENTIAYTDPKKLTFLGVYASQEDVLMDFPEYVI